MQVLRMYDYEEKCTGVEYSKFINSVKMRMLYVSHYYLHFTGFIASDVSTLNSYIGMNKEKNRAT
jgi:hypothetical protein